MKLIVETCISFVGNYLIRMVRSVETKRMRGTKEKIGWPEEFKYDSMILSQPSKKVLRHRRSVSYSFHVVLIHRRPIGWQHVPIHILWWRICIFVLIDKKFVSVIGDCVFVKHKLTLSSLLWIDKTRTKDKTYKWVSVWWKTWLCCYNLFVYESIKWEVN
jgi:hypothetical protein